ncbi:MAG: hypothetical protein U1D55_16765 [Phycisphaerae bacterium]
MFILDGTGATALVFFWTFERHAWVENDIPRRITSAFQKLGFQLGASCVAEELRNVAIGDRFVPRWLESESAKGSFLECQRLDSYDVESIELQFGAVMATEWYFERKQYTTARRAALLDAIESLCACPGFEIGLSLFCGKDQASEGMCRYWLGECIDDGRVNIGRLLRHDWLIVYSLHAGQSYLEQYGRSSFLSCPAWRVRCPTESSICVFFNNLDPSGAFAAEDRIEPCRRALQHLRAAFPVDAADNRQK